VLADLLAVSPRSITDLAKRGIVVRSAKGRGFDLRLSTRGHADHLRRLAGGRGGEGAINTATAERARLAKEQADAVALKNAIARGELLVAAEVEKTWTATFAGVKAIVLTGSSRIGQRLPHLGLGDIAEIDAELRALLTEAGGGAL
jgi:phage terminase Nu1 subunit (DNA packaging protein)